MLFQFQNSLNLAILVREKMGKDGANSRKNVNNKKTCQKIGIEILNFFLLFLMSKSLKLILVITTLNTQKIPKSNILENK
jgi:hypothetical protein